jgi:hypothetical protein
MSEIWYPMTSQYGETFSQWRISDAGRVARRNSGSCHDCGDDECMTVVSQTEIEGGFYYAMKSDNNQVMAIHESLIQEALEAQQP